VGLARSGVIDESPFAAVVFVADDKVEGCEHGQDKSLELQESMTPVGGPVGVSERGPLGLGRKVRALLSVGILDRCLHSGVLPPLPACSLPKKKKKELLEHLCTLLARTGEA
jgi:hypothetical protein